MNKAYFARWGKVFGPFREDEVMRMQADGKLKDFAWMWDEARQEWKPLDPAPPRLQPEAAGTVPVSSQIEAICHNRHHYVSGALECLTETGCEFLSGHPEISPVFADHSAVLLNLLESGSGRMLNVQARVCAVTRTSMGQWRYQLRWEQRPIFA